MRDNCRPFELMGVSHGKGQGSAALTTVVRQHATTGRQQAFTFETMNFSGPFGDRSIAKRSMFKT
jgi:hypothetical protein